MAEVYGEPCVQGHSAAIYDRGGVNRITPLFDLATVDWNRARNKVTGSTITMIGKSCAGQIDQINAIEPHRHEMVVFRGSDRVWEGPVLQSSTLNGVGTVIAQDVGAYLAGTPLSKPWPNSDAGGPPLMTDRIEEIITYELTTPYSAEVGTETTPETVLMLRWEQFDPPANVLPFLEVRPGTVLTRSSTEAIEMSVMDHLQDLARSGVDFATIGRRFLVWDSEDALGRTRQVTEADFVGGLELIASGADHANIFHVSATRKEDAAGGLIGVGNAGRPDDYYGAWTMIYTSETEQGDSADPDQWALNTQARRGLAGRNPVPIEIRMPGKASLKLSRDLTINDLIPGMEVPVLATVNKRKVSQTMIIDKVNVKEVAAGETVSVTLVPTGVAQVS